MKNNRKNRKLNFIRSKNRLRKGFIGFYLVGKISNEIYKSDLLKEIIEEYIDEAKQNCLKKFRISLPFKCIDFSCLSEDYPKDLISFKIELKR